MIDKAWGEGRENYAAVICLARHCGLRVHEIFRLDTATAQSAIDTGQLTLMCKGGKVRTIPLPRTAQLELKTMLRQTPRGHKLFVSDNTPTDLAINRFQYFLYRHRNAV